MQGMISFKIEDWRSSLKIVWRSAALLQIQRIGNFDHWNSDPFWKISWILNRVELAHWMLRKLIRTQSSQWFQRRKIFCTTSPGSNKNSVSNSCHWIWNTFTPELFQFAKPAILFTKNYSVRGIKRDFPWFVHCSQPYYTMHCSQPYYTIHCSQQYNVLNKIFPNL